MAYSEADQEVLYQAITESVEPILPLEKEWDGEKLSKKICEYLGKAAKGVAGARKPWTEVVTDFASKFFEAFWRALGEREWLDQVDFTWIVGAGMKAYCPMPAFAQISEEEYMQQVVIATEQGFDSSRYYSWSWQVLKRVVTGKAAQKKVREAIDNAREEVVQQLPGTAEGFISAWVKTTVDMLAKGGGNPQMHLPESDAIRLFTEMIQDGGGLPLTLQNAAGGLTESIFDEVGNSVSAAYAEYPPDASAAPPPLAIKGGGYGKAMGMPGSFGMKGGCLGMKGGCLGMKGGWGWGKGSAPY